MLDQQKGLYNNIKDSLYNCLVDSFNASEEPVDIYNVPFQNIATFPAISIEAVRRTKTPKGIGIAQYGIEFNVWVYTDVLDSIEAEEQCLRITDATENYLMRNKTLGGIVSTLTVNEDIQFGVVQQGENNFLQGARIPVMVTSKMVNEVRTPCKEETNEEGCSCG